MAAHDWDYRPGRGGERPGRSEVRVLKTVALLNVLDAEHLTATDAALSAALLDQESFGEICRTVTALKQRGLLFDRGATGGYCLWPNTSVNLEAAFSLARRALGPADRIADNWRRTLTRARSWQGGIT